MHSSSACLPRACTTRRRLHPEFTALLVPSGPGCAGTPHWRPSPPTLSTSRCGYFPAVSDCLIALTVPCVRVCVQECDSSGIRKGTSPTMCVQCQGTGQIVQALRTPLGTFQQVAVCPTCQGTGQSFVPCSKCGGDGRVQETKRISLKVGREGRGQQGCGRRAGGCGMRVRIRGGARAQGDLGWAGTKGFQRCAAPVRQCVRVRSKRVEGLQKAVQAGRMRQGGGAEGYGRGCGDR